MSIEVIDEFRLSLIKKKFRNFLLVTTLITIGYFIIAVLGIFYIKFWLSVTPLTAEGIAEFIIAESITLSLMYIQSLFIAIWLIEYRS